MARVLQMPSVAANATRAVVNEWILQEGDAFGEADCIAMIETDKAVVELAAESSGVIGKLLVGQGEEVEVGAPIAILLDAGEDQREMEKLLAALEMQFAAAGYESSTPQLQAAQDASERTGIGRTEYGSGDAGGVKGSEQFTLAGGSRIFASPLARRIAEQAGVSLSTIHGSGPNGRIVKADIERVCEKAVAGGVAQAGQDAVCVARQSGEAARSAHKGLSATSVLGASAFRAVPHSGMSKTIARRLCESKASVPHYYLTQTFRVDGLLALRKEVNAQLGGEGRVSVNDFIIRAVAVALRDVPQANVRWTDEEMHHFEHADVGVAVSTDTGLITPIIRAADTKTVAAISREMSDLVTRARVGSLKSEEFQGGSFGISNMGMYGIESFAAIINPPQAGILAVGAAEQAPAVEDGRIVPATLLRCTLSADHRAMNGIVAAQWMRRLKHYVEHPLAMLI